LEELVRYGKVRFAHARTFNDTSLKPAQSDDEHHRIYTLDFSVHVVDIYGTDGNVHHFGSLPSLQMFHRIGDREGRLIDYYIYCFTSKYDSRFFAEFGADACLMISHPEEFYVRLIRACHARYPRCQFIAGKCKYYDPTEMPSPAKRSEMVFMKSNLYSWQEEVRVFFYFHSNEEFPDYLTIEAGPMTDICNFVEA
jgi:hypothetical protein